MKRSNRRSVSVITLKRASNSRSRGVIAWLVSGRCFLSSLLARTVKYLRANSLTALGKRDYSPQQISRACRVTVPASSLRSRRLRRERPFARRYVRHRNHSSRSAKMNACCFAAFQATPSETALKFKRPAIRTDLLQNVRSQGRLGLQCITTSKSWLSKEF